jgi:hypothetical protein
VEGIQDVEALLGVVERNATQHEDAAMLFGRRILFALFDRHVWDAAAGAGRLRKESDGERFRRLFQDVPTAEAIYHGSLGKVSTHLKDLARVCAYPEEPGKRQGGQVTRSLQPAGHELVHSASDARLQCPAFYASDRCSCGLGTGVDNHRGSRMRVLVFVAALALLSHAGQAALAAPKANDPADSVFHPQEVAAGMFEKWQREAAKNASAVVAYTYTRVEYDKKTFWVADAHYGDGVPYKSIAVYAPAKDGSFRRCLLADSNQAGWLAVTVNPKSGLLELRERANSDIKGEVVLSCNLKTVGTPHSTGVTR